MWRTLFLGKVSTVLNTSIARWTVEFVLSMRTKAVGAHGGFEVDLSAIHIEGIGDYQCFQGPDESVMF